MDITLADVNQLGVTDAPSGSTDLLNAAIHAKDLDAYLDTLNFDQVWDLYELAGSLDVVFGESAELRAKDPSLVNAINWIALCAKARTQRHHTMTIWLDRFGIRTRKVECYCVAGRNHNVYQSKG